MGARETAPPPPQPLYFINAPVDMALVGGVSIVAFLLLLLFYDSSQRTHMSILLATPLMWIGNWPHFSATNYRLYHSRANIVQYPMTALVIPWVILAGISGSILYPALIAPYFAKIFLIWSPYHFSGQSFGICLIYARRAGFKVGKLERFALSSFIFATFIYPTVSSEASVESAEYYKIKYPGMGLPDWTVTAAGAWVAITGVALLILVARWCLQHRRMLPPIVLLPAATQLVWFIFGPTRQSFTELVPFFHSLQYLLIAWSMQLKEKMDLNNIEPSRRYVVAESIRWGLMNVAGGACLFYVIPEALAVGASLDPIFATGIVITGVQIHHFFVDGVIWKLKRQTVSSPLMVNISDLIAPAAVAGKGAA